MHFLLGQAQEEKHTLIVIPAFSSEASTGQRARTRGNRLANLVTEADPTGQTG